MALQNIVNGDIPDATPVMANFNYLLGLIDGGAGIQSGTFAVLRAAAALAPTTPFICIATDEDLFLLYCGKAARGDGGFITLASFGGIS